MDKLPLDIIFNIFSRLPVKSLLRLRCVSKLWRNIIDDPCFANIHLAQAIEEHTVLVLGCPTHKRNLTSLYIIKEDGESLKARTTPIAELANLKNYSLQGSCNGLLYFAQSNYLEGVILLNPLTRQSLMLPPATIPTPWPAMKKYGLGFDYSTNTYKIVSVFFRELEWKSDSLGVEVHTLGTSSWREISKVPPYPLCGKPVSAYGALHWICHTLLDCVNLKAMIISFDIVKEVFNFTPHPDFGLKNCDMFQLVDLRGCLAMVDCSSDAHIDIWVVTDYNKKEWRRDYRINIKAPIGQSNNGNFKVIGLLENGEILLSYINEGYFCYNPKTDEIRFIHTSGLIPDTTTSELYSHRGSLVSCSRFMAD